MHINWTYETNNDGLNIDAGPKKIWLNWRDIIFAGMAYKMPFIFPVDFPVDNRIFPFIGHLIATAEELSFTTENLLIAYCTPKDRKKLLTLNLLNKGSDHDAFLVELKERLSDRWLGSDIPLMELRRQMGVSNWWVMPATLLAFIIAAVVIFTWWYFESLFNQNNMINYGR